MADCATLAAVDLVLVTKVSPLPCRVYYRAVVRRPSLPALNVLLVWPPFLARFWPMAGLRLLMPYVSFSLFLCCDYKPKCFAKSTIQLLRRARKFSRRDLLCVDALTAQKRSGLSYLWWGSDSHYSLFRADAAAAVFRTLSAALAFCDWSAAPAAMSRVCAASLAVIAIFC